MTVSYNNASEGSRQREPRDVCQLCRDVCRWMEVKVCVCACELDKMMHTTCLSSLPRNVTMKQSVTHSDVNNLHLSEPVLFFFPCAKATVD